MAKKLNEKSIRQGQTVYVVSAAVDGSLQKKYLPTKVRVNNSIMPRLSERPVRNGSASRLFVKNVIIPSNEMFSDVFVYYSRRKAVRKAKELNHYAGVSV